MQRRLQLFVSGVITKISHTWLVGIQTTLSAWQMFGVLIYVNIYRSAVWGLLPSTGPLWSQSGPLVWCLLGMSRRLWPAYLLLWWAVKDAFRRSPPRPPHLCCPQMWCQDNRGRGVRAASHQLCKLKATLGPDFCNYPLVWFLWAYAFLCLYCLLMISM